MAIDWEAAINGTRPVKIKATISGGVVQRQELAVRILCVDRNGGDDKAPPVIGLVLEPPRPIAQYVGGTLLQGTASEHEAIGEWNLDGTCPGNDAYNLVQE